MLTNLKTTKNTLVNIRHVLSSGCMLVVTSLLQAIRAVETAGNPFAVVKSSNKTQIIRLLSLTQNFLIILSLITILFIKRVDFSLQVNNYAFFLFMYSMLVLMITLPGCVSDRIGFRKVEMKP